MKPYYDDGKGIVIYHGDCREIVPTMGKFDLLLTDPPYGLGADNLTRILSRGRLAAPTNYGESDWDAKPAEQDLIDACRSVGSIQIIWGGNYFLVPPSSCWLVWNKLNGATDFADCELAWTNMEKAVRKFDLLWNGMLRGGEARGVKRVHPTQKPVELMTWCITLAGDVQTILDPFAGSGTTGLAAKYLGRKCTMIEREEKYAEIAAKRMQQEVLQFA